MLVAADRAKNVAVAVLGPVNQRTGHRGTQGRKLAPHGRRTARNRLIGVTVGHTGALATGARSRQVRRNDAVARTRSDAQ